MDRAYLKENAKKSLNGKYGKAIIVFLIYGIMTSIGTIIIKFLPTLGSIIDFILLTLVALGYKEYFLKISRGEDPEIDTLFNHTKDFKKTFIVTLLTGLFVAVGLILLVVPGIIISISLSQVLYIMLDNPDMKYDEVLKKSKEMMNGHKKEYFILQLSFLGWMLLDILTFGILSLWLVPYMEETYAAYYNYLLNGINAPSTSNINSPLPNNMQTQVDQVSNNINNNTAPASNSMPSQNVVPSMQTNVVSNQNAPAQSLQTSNINNNQNTINNMYTNNQNENIQNTQNQVNNNQNNNM